MDYKRNADFFQNSVAKSAKIFKIVGIALCLVGVIFMILVFTSRSLMKLQIVPLVLLVGGIVAFFWGDAKIVKEEELTDVLDIKQKQVEDIVYEIFNYPANFRKQTKSFVGCDYTKNPGVVRQLNNKEYMSPDCVVTQIYFATEGRKIGAFVYMREFSMLSEAQKDTQKLIKFEDFDDAGVGHIDLGEGKKATVVCFYKEGQKIYEFPVMNSDYYSEEFFADLLHARKRYLKIKI